MSEYPTFGEMTKEERSEIVEAIISGKRIEALDAFSGEWNPLSGKTTIVLSIFCRYRIAPTKPSIDWSHVHPDYDWLAESAPGRGLLFKGKPSLSPTGFGLAWCGAAPISAGTFASYRSGTCKSEDSLVMRPEGV